MTDEEKDEQFYRDTESVAFPKLDDRQLALLEPLGKRRVVRRDEIVFKAGQRDLPMIVILSGELEVFEAVCAASEGLQTVVLESYAPGGQAGSSSLIEKFFGFPTGISGGDLTYRAQLQAFRFGAKISTPCQRCRSVFAMASMGRSCTAKAAPRRCARSA